MLFKTFTSKNEQENVELRVINHQKEEEKLLHEAIESTIKNLKEEECKSRNSMLLQKECKQAEFRSKINTTETQTEEILVLDLEHEVKKT